MGASCRDGGCRQAGGWHTRIPRASWQLPALQSGALSFPGAGTCRRQAGRPPNVPSVAGDGLAPAPQAAIPAAPRLHEGIELSPCNSPKPVTPFGTPKPRLLPAFCPIFHPDLLREFRTGAPRASLGTFPKAGSGVQPIYGSHSPPRTPDTITTPPSVTPSPAGAAAASRAASAAGWRS